MIHLRQGVPLEAQANLPEQLRCHGQIDLRGGESHVPQIYGELGQQPLDIGSLTIPCYQPMDRGRVSQVMKPGLLTVGMVDSCKFSKSLERITNYVVVCTSPRAKHKEGRFLTLVMTFLGSPARVSLHDLVQLKAERDESGLVEFRVAHSDQGGVKVHIS
jgi:hypothetical protein